MILSVNSDYFLNSINSGPYYTSGTIDTVPRAYEGMGGGENK
jgi:hypothetical protein